MSHVAARDGRVRMPQAGLSRPARPPGPRPHAFSNRAGRRCLQPAVAWGPDMTRPAVLVLKCRVLGVWRLLK